MVSAYVSGKQKNFNHGPRHKCTIIVLFLFTMSAIVNLQLNQKQVILRKLHRTRVKESGEYDCTDITQNRTYITFISHRGRLGNVLFTLASLYGIAERNSMFPVLVRQNNAGDNNHMFKVLQQINFNILVYENICFSNCAHLNYTEKNDKMYDKNTENLNMLLTDTKTRCNLIQLEGYFQSWKYFSIPRNEVIKHITFKQQDILQSNKTVTMFKQASLYQRYLHKRVIELNCTETSNLSLYQKKIKNLLLHELRCSQVKMIGIHIRRGDMLHPEQKGNGYVVPDASYFYHAMDYFQGKVYPLTKLLFVVCTDSIEWSKNNIKGDNVVYSEANSVAVDLYLLSICDGLIISLSTFSFWAAYLSEGKVIYYKNWFLPNSKVAKSVKLEDYYLPNWIPLT